MAVPTPSWISLRELLTVQGQPVTEGQAWALCYHGCLAIQRQQSPASIWAGWLMNWKQPLFRTVDDLILNEDGTVVCVSADDKKNMCTEDKVIESLGVLIYKALDWSLGEEEERVLSLSLECLIQQMVLRSEDQSPVTINEILKLCQNHLLDSTAVLDFQAVNKALFAEAVELRKRLSHITSAKKNLKILLEEDSLDKASLESPCWSRMWFQLMKEVRGGVRLRNTSERSYTPVPVKAEPSSFMKILDDIKYKRYILHKVALINNEPRVSCKAVLDLGLLRSLLKPATARKLRDAPPSSPCLHEMLMSEIQSAVKKLQPVSSDGDDQSLSSLDSSVQTRLQYQDLHTDHKPPGQHQQMRRCRKPQFMGLETEEDLSGLEQNSAQVGQSLDVVYKQADVSTERESTKPSSWLDVTLVRHSINKYKFQYPLQTGKPFGMGYEFVENEEFHFSSSLYIKELVCVCQTVAKREVRNRKMVKDKFCFYCQREFFFTWALTCHFCKKINLFRVLYEDANPLPCMHLPVICKPSAATADAGVQVETCRCGWEKVKQWDTSDWKPTVQSQEPTHLIEAGCEK